MRYTWILLWCLSLYSCKKDKKSVPADVAVYVKHHGALIPGATVHVKHGSGEFPGTDPALYDETAMAGTTDHSKGHAHFEGLAAGKHYFYATGYDSTIMDDVMGGISLTIEEREEKQELTLDIPVTE
jgi:hypothetical protein